MKLIRILSIFFTILMVAACDKLDDKLLDNPNGPTPETADVNLYFNEVQLDFKNFYGGMSNFGEQLTRMEHMYGPLFANAYSGGSFNGVWYDAYAAMFKNANAMIPVAEKANLTTHVGAVKILKAYALMVLVDNFGDVPLTEANNLEITNPKLDPGADVYKAALALLDEAIASLAKTPGANPTSDLYYGGDRVKWTTLAKTLKLRAYMTTRLVDGSAKDKINTLLTENDLIDTDAEDFVFRYGNKFENPNSRHPKYNGSYNVVGGVSPYISNHFIWSLRKEKGMDDPRLRYYLIRQTLNYNYDAFTIPCNAQSRPAHYPAEASFCIAELGNGYWGRDFGDGSGIPPDNKTRTGWGIYPAGGAFDNDQGGNTVEGQGGKGAGINPIWMSFFTELLKAESALVLKTTGDPKVLLESGVRKSINRVINFPTSVGITVPANRVPNADSITVYVNKVKSLYDAAATDDAKLNIIIKELRLASWGNGLEIYNAYRRTGKPDNFQPTLAPDPGAFIRSFYFPSDYVNFNKGAKQKTTTDVKVFWDTNPAKLK